MDAIPPSVYENTTFQYLFTLHEDIFAVLSEIETNLYVRYTDLLDDPHFKRLMFLNPDLPACENMTKMALIMLLICFGKAGFDYLEKHHLYIALGCCFVLIDKTTQSQRLDLNFVPMVQTFITRRVCMDYPSHPQQGVEVMRPWIQPEVADQVASEFSSAQPIQLH